jgi:hypothetical protein
MSEPRQIKIRIGYIGETALHRRLGLARISCAEREDSLTVEDFAMCSLLLRTELNVEI